MANAAVVNAGVRYLTDGQVSWVSTTQVRIAAGAARNQENNNDIVWDSALDVYTDASGAGGIDTGSIAASTPYYLYVVGDSFKNNSPVGVLSTESDGPEVIPSGYDEWVLVAHGIYSDGSSHILPFIRNGNDLVREHYYNTPIAIVTNGAATTFTDVDAAAYVPANTIVYLKGALTPNSAGNQVQLRSKASSATAGNSGFSAVVAAVEQIMPVEVQVNSASLFQYLVSNGSDSVDLYIVGFKDVL